MENPRRLVGKVAVATGAGHRLTRERLVVDGGQMAL
jgi:hypothetical protein